MKLKYANGRKLLDPNKLSPIGLLPGVSLAWCWYQSRGITDSFRYTKIEWLGPIKERTMVLMESMVSPPSTWKTRENSEKHEIPKEKDPKTTKTTR